MQTLNNAKDKAVETIKPVLTSAIEKTTPVLTSAIESTIQYVERIDPEAKQREHVFSEAAAGAVDENAEDPTEERKSNGEELATEGQTSTALKQLKVVSEDLIDLWLFEGSKGLRYVQASKAYQITDPYVQYVEKYEAVKSKSQALVAKLEELPKKVTLFYDEATKFVGMLIHVVRDRQDALVEYVKNTYENVHIFVQDNYLRLDFNKDGSVSMEDLRGSLMKFYEFLKSFDYLEATTRISSNLYDQAVSMIKKDQVDGQQQKEVTEQTKPEGATNVNNDDDDDDLPQVDDFAAAETEQKVSQDDLAN